MNKSAQKIALVVLGIVVLLAGAVVHNRFLYTKALSEEIYTSPINLKSPYSIEDIKKSSYVDLEKLRLAIDTKAKAGSNPDAVFMAPFPKQELYPIVQEVPTLPASLNRFESYVPSIARLHFLLYRDLKCESLGCSLQKYSFVFSLGIILVGVAFYIAEHKSSFTKKKFAKITFLVLGSSAIVFMVFYVASILVVVQLKNQSLDDIKKAVITLNTQDTTSAGNKNFYTARDPIAVYLTVSKKAPLIYEPHNKQEILAIYLFPENQNVSFYEKYVLVNSIVEKDYLSDALKPTMYLFDDSKLVIYKYNKDDLQVLMPVLSKNIISSQFSAFNPKVSRNIDFKVLDQVEYQEFQEKKEEELKKEVNKYIALAQEEINKVNNAINESKNYLKDIENYMDTIDDQYKTYVKEPQEEYDKYCEGGFEDYPECKYLKSIIDTNKKRLKEAERTLEAERQKIKDFEKDAEKANTELKAQLNELYQVMKLINDNPVNTEYQKGVFFPGEMGIKLRYFDENSENMFQERIADKESKSVSEKTKLAYDYILSGYSKTPTFSQYLMTSLHEYLHAIAYYDNYEWPDSIEESMTEHLSLEAGFPYIYDKSKLDRIVYTDNVRMTKKMLDKLDRDTLLQLYFNDKTDKSLRNEFARVYSKYNYDTFKKDSDTLLYMNYDDISTRKEFLDKMSKQLENN